MKLSLFITADFFRKNLNEDFHSFRCRQEEGKFQIRPTDRTNKSQMIKNQDLVNISVALLGYEFKVPFPVGNYSLEPSTHGWFTLVKGGNDIKITQVIEVPVQEIEDDIIAGQTVMTRALETNSLV